MVRREAEKRVAQTPGPAAPCGQKKAAPKSGFSFDLVPFALSGGLSLFLSLYAGLFVMLMFTDLRHDAGFLAGTLKTAQSAV